MTRTQASISPATSNPSASELYFNPAAEGRDVEARLTKMWQETGSYTMPVEQKPLIDPTVDDSGEKGDTGAQRGTGSSGGEDAEEAKPEKPAPTSQGSSDGAASPGILKPRPGDAAAAAQPEGTLPGAVENDQPEDAPAGPAPAGAIEVDLATAFKIAQRSAREHRNQEDTYLVTAISLLLERNQWTPRLSNDTSAVLDGGGDEGRYDNAVRLVNDLRVTQRLPYGGRAEAAWVWEASEQLRSSVTGQYRQASRFVAEASIPLLRSAGLIARESLIQAERDLIYSARDYERFRRSFLVDIANDYFRLVQLRSQIANQNRSLKSLQNLEEATTALFDAGRVKAFDKNIASSNVKSAISSLLNLRESYALAIDRFKVRLGLPVDTVIAIQDLKFEMFEPDISLTDATVLALAYRLDLQNQRDRLEDARRGVANARNQLLPDLNATGSVSIPTDDDTREGGAFLDPDQTDYTVGLTFGLPLDRRDEALRLRQAQIRLERQKRDVDRARDDIVVEVRGALRGIELARVQLQLADQRVQIARRRLEEQNLKKDIVKPQEIVDSENELLSAENQRDQALADLRNAVLNYLLASDQLRVARDGTFQPLPGMPAASR